MSISLDAVIFGGLIAANALLWVFICRKPRNKAVSLEDIEHLIHAGAHQGALDPAEQLLAGRALRLGDRTVRDIMRPRIEIDALDVDTPADEVIGAVAMSGFSRLPIHEGDLDHIIGFVYTKDLLLRQHMGWPIELRKLVRPPLLVPESLRIDKLLERFRQKRTQMAIVLDEFGGTEGLVTMEDVLEELVGEIHDEHRAERQQQIVARDVASWFVDAGLPLHELLERIEMSRSPQPAAGGGKHGGRAGTLRAGANTGDGRFRHLAGADVRSRGHGRTAAGAGVDTQGGVKQSLAGSLQFVASGYIIQAELAYFPSANDSLGDASEARLCQGNHHAPGSIFDDCHFALVWPQEPRPKTRTCATSRPTPSTSNSFCHRRLRSVPRSRRPRST